MSHAKDMTGVRVGRLTVLTEAGRRNGLVFWLCQCDCGTQKPVSGYDLRSGHTVSCGCWRREAMSQLRHGHAVGHRGTAEYVAWTTMKRRCTDPSVDAYPLYGGRGIGYDARWEEFDSFLADMGPRPSSRHSLDRIDNSKGYGPTNCRWATPQEQGRNKRSNRLITAFGRTATLVEWSEETGFKPECIHKRLSLGWDSERALSEPVDGRKAWRRKSPPDIAGVLGLGPKEAA